MEPGLRSHYSVEEQASQARRILSKFRSQDAPKNMTRGATRTCPPYHRDVTAVCPVQSSSGPTTIPSLICRLGQCKDSRLGMTTIRTYSLRHKPVLVPFSGICRLCVLVRGLPKGTRPSVHVLCSPPKLTGSRDGFLITAAARTRPLKILESPCQGLPKGSKGGSVEA